MMFTYLYVNQFDFYMVAFLASWLFILPRFWGATRHRNIDNYSIHSATAIVTCYKENLDDFERSIKSLKNSIELGTEEHEIIVVIDGLEDGVENEEVLLARKYADIVLTHNNKNKRKAIELAISQAKYDIIVSSDSDTFYEDETVKYLLMPFVDESVGGVTSAQRIYNPKTLVERTCDWMEHTRLYSGMGAAGAFGAVLCLPGRAIAWRKKPILDVINDFVNEDFFGRICISGDDRYVTNVLLKNGYKTLLQTNAKVTTLAPETFTKWCKQQLRWSRSSQRYTLQSLSWLWKHPMTLFVAITDVLMTFIVTLCVANWVWSIFTGNLLNSSISLLLISLLSMSANLGIKHVKHFKEVPSSTLKVPMFALISSLLQLIRFYGFVTMFKVNTWGTRSGKKYTFRGRKAKI